jgi:hypothetical protein
VTSIEHQVLHPGGFEIGVGAVASKGIDIGAIAAIPGRPGQRHPLARDPEIRMRRHNLALGPQTLISG